MSRCAGWVFGSSILILSLFHLGSVFGIWLHSSFGVTIAPDAYIFINSLCVSSLGSYSFKGVYLKFSLIWSQYSIVPFSAHLYFGLPCFLAGGVLGFKLFSNDIECIWSLRFMFFFDFF